MLKKTISIIFLLVIISWAGGYIFLHYLPPFASLTHKGKLLAKKIATKASSIIYREATIHNPPGDVLPDDIDDRIKHDIKEAF